MTLANTKGSPYIVTEFLEGDTLRGRLSSGALPETVSRQAWEWVRNSRVRGLGRRGNGTHQRLSRWRPENLVKSSSCTPSTSPLFERVHWSNAYRKKVCTTAAPQPSAPSLPVSTYRSNCAGPRFSVSPIIRGIEKTLDLIDSAAGVIVANLNESTRVL